jgi:excisionase family DNA binding protein
VDEKRLLTVAEAARRLGIGRSHAYIYVLRGELESVKLGKSRRIPTEAVEDFVQRLRADSDLNPSGQ